MVIKMIIHIVEQGETIWSISQEYGISPERLIADNGLWGLNVLVAGQALMILQPETVYTVNAGDTPYSISQKFGISVNNLKQKNPSLAQTNTINTGEILTVSYVGESNTDVSIYGFLYPNIKTNILNQSLPFLEKAALFSYGIKANGELVTLNDSQLISRLKGADTAPIMVLSSINEEGNFDSSVASEVFNDAAIQDVLIENIINTLKERGYAGIDIDFEYVSSDDRDVFIRFVSKIHSSLNPLGYSVNVDLAPKTSSTQTGVLYEGHDYAELGEAADTVMVMTYEWGYTYSEPMAVAPINQVKKVLDYAVSQIDRNKIYMGIPNYGYDWKLPYEKGITRARLIGNEEAISIASQHNAYIEFDEKSQTPYFTYISDDGANHEVWFEDIRSIKAKFDLRDEYNLRGVAYWNLMRSFNQNWIYSGYRYNPIKQLFFS